MDYNYPFPLISRMRDGKKNTKDLNAEDKQE